MKTVIFDLDNCLANDSDRIPLIDWSCPNLEERYAAYHNLCGDDPVGNLSAFEEATLDATPVFLTARPVRVQQMTENWLFSRLGVRDPTLLMRNNGDNRRSVVIKQEQLGALVAHYGVAISEIAAAYDDRSDIVEMYRSLGVPASVLKIHDQCAYTRSPSSVTAGDVLADMAKTFRERNAVYKDNFRVVGKVMHELQLDGVTLNSAKDHELFHLYSLLVVKLTRFTASGLTHEDSITDLCVYGAMIGAILKERSHG